MRMSPQKIVRKLVIAALLFILLVFVRFCFTESTILVSTVPMQGYLYQGCGSVSRGFDSVDPETINRETWPAMQDVIEHPLVYQVMINTNRSPILIQIPDNINPEVVNHRLVAQLKNDP